MNEMDKRRTGRKIQKIMDATKKTATDILRKRLLTYWLKSTAEVVNNELLEILFITI
jgi:hypothetical protein